MSADRRLLRFRRLLDHARARLGLDLGFRLWDGSTVPDDLPPDALCIAIADEGAVAAMLRRPNVETLANLWVAARVDIVNGTLFDLVARRPKVRTKALVKTLDKGLLVRTLAAFLAVPRGGPFPLEAVPRAPGVSDGSEGENKRNVSHHYDASNAFYELFLDPAMVYTCGYFTDFGNDLATAQQDKLEMICRKLRLRPGERMLDIGCGWGALVCYAAQHYGVRAHGVTLSREQFAYAQARVQAAGLGDLVTLELRDYRLVEGPFDKISSIGMFEAIGVSHFPTYFQTVHRLLKPGGLYLHHAITRPGGSGAARGKKKRPEFAALTRYIFPGGELDHLGRTIDNLERYGFEVHDVEGWREHYQRTCRFWHDRLLARYDEACKEVGEVTTRVWLAYLAACSITFERNNARLYQTLSSKRRKGASGLPPTRGDLYV